MDMSSTAEVHHEEHPQAHIKAVREPREETNQQLHHHHQPIHSGHYSQVPESLQSKEGQNSENNQDQDIPTKLDNDEEETFALELKHSNLLSDMLLLEWSKHLLDSGKFSDLVIETEDLKIKVHKFFFSIACPNVDLSLIDKVRVNAPNSADIYNLLELVYTGRVATLSAEEINKLKHLMVLLGCWNRFIRHFKHVPKFLFDDGNQIFKTSEQIFEFINTKEVIKKENIMSYDDSVDQEDFGNTEEYEEDPEDFFIPDFLEQEDLEVGDDLEFDDLPPPKRIRKPKMKVKKEPGVFIKAENGAPPAKKLMKKKKVLNTENDSPNKSKFSLQNLEYHIVNGESIHRDKLGFGCPACDSVWKGTSSKLRYTMPMHFKRYHPTWEKSKIKEVIDSLPRSINYVGPDGHPLLRLYKERTRTEYKFACPNCDKKLGMFNDLKDHVLLVHNGENLAALDGIDRKPYKCKMCDACYSLPQRYQEHMKEKHSDESWQCEICAKTLPNKKTLQHHILRVHTKGTGEKNCKVCGHYFERRSKLLDHMNIHKGIKPYECATCKKHFSTKAQMLRHDSLVHKDVRNFVCEYCAKRFGCKAKRSDHIDAIHLNIKRHACTYCQQRFSCRGNLSKHMKSHGIIRETKVLIQDEPPSHLDTSEISRTFNIPN